MIGEILKNLSDKDHKTIMYAFEEGLEQYIPIDEGKFIGVNIVFVKNLIIEQVEGAFSYGSISDDSV